MATDEKPIPLEIMVNGDLVDAYTYCGLRMGDGFLAALLAPVPLKDYIESNCRLAEGATVIVATTRRDSREVSLPFTVYGATPAEFAENREQFYALLYAGAVSLSVPPVGDEVYHLIYKKSAEYGQNRARTICTITVKFSEPDPTNRQ